MRNKGIKVIAVILAVIFPFMLFAEEFKNVKYKGGMPGFDQEANGALEITNDSLTFKAGVKKFSFLIDLKTITEVSTSINHRGGIGIKFVNKQEKIAAYVVFIINPKDAKNTVKLVIEQKLGRTFDEEEKTDSDKKQEKEK